MGAEMNVAASVLLDQSAAIGGQQHGNRIGHQQQAGGHRTGRAIEPRKTHAGILQIDVIHQVMQGDVSVMAAQAA